MQKRILVVDDDHSVCETLQIALSYCNYNVKTSGPTNEILDLINEFKPDIILIDYLLQGIDGRVLCHEVRENADTNNLPVIMISAYANNFEEIDTEEFDRVLHKPFGLEELLKTVDQLT